jgi:hypothetical protein
MPTAPAVEDREALRDATLECWAANHAINLARFDAGQLWFIFLGLRIAAHLGEVASLKRVLGYFLAASKLELGSTAIAAIIGVSDRAVRSAQVLAPSELLHSVQHPVGGHAKPKLAAHHSGPIAKFLVEHPRATVQEVLEFIYQAFSVSLDRKTLRTYIAKYGLGCLRGEVVEDSPLFWEPHDSAAHSS